jgi:hypothetical protein
VQYLIVAAIGIGVVWVIYRRRQHSLVPCVSTQWLDEQQTRSSRGGIDGVTWRWPVTK